MPLNAGIIGGIRPLPTPAEMADERQKREIQQQEVELRRQEILARRDAIRQAAMQKAQPNPQQQKQEFDLRIAKAQTLTNLLEGANEANWPVVKGIAQHLVGDDANDLPDQFPGPEWLQPHIAAGRQATTKLAEMKTRAVTTVDANGQPVTRIVEDKPGQEFPIVPKTAAETAAQGFTLAPGARRFDAQGNLIATAPDRPAGSGGAEPLVDVIGPDGKRVLVPRSQAVGKTPGAAGTASSKPATGAQNKVLGFFNRAKQADDDLTQLETEISKLGFTGQARMSYGYNWMQSQLGQSYNQAQRAFTEARLRKDSGAAIPNSEFDNDRKTYFAQPGDSPATLAQKARARSAVLASLAYESGPALSGFYGDEDAGTMLSDFKKRAGGAAPHDAKADPLGIR